MSYSFRVACAFACAFFSVTGLRAQIVVGYTSGFTGPVAAGVKENLDGAKLYIDEINSRGGVKGQKIELVTIDDKFDPKLSAENVRTLVATNGAVALLLTRGTANAEAMLPMLEELSVPLIGPSTGAMVMHTPVKKWVFNVKSTFRLEAQKAVELLNTIGISQIGVLHADDSFGRDGLAGLTDGFAKAKLKPMFEQKFDRTKPNFASLPENLTKSKPQAVFVVGSSSAAAEALKVMREAGSKAQLVTLSNNASAGFLTQMGKNGAGTIITQVFPNERSTMSPLIKEALEM